VTQLRASTADFSPFNRFRNMRYTPFALLVAAAASASGCGIGGILGSDLEIYSLVSVNGQPARVEKGEHVLIGTVQHEGQTCTLETFGGKFDLYPGEGTYSAFVSIGVRCPGRQLGEANATDEGLYIRRGDDLSLSTLRRNGFEMSTARLRSDQVSVEAIFDGPSLAPGPSSTLVITDRIPVTLVYRRTI
jgi:hypothetical protein